MGTSLPGRTFRAVEISSGSFVALPRLGLGKVGIFKPIHSSCLGLCAITLQVRSCTLDTWLPEQVAFMSATGNAVANSYWEALLPAGARPTSGDRNELTKFISMKYAKEWADGTWPPAPAVAASLPTQASLAPPARTQHPEASPAPTAGGGSFWTAFDDPPPAAATSTSSQAPPHASQGGSFWGVLEDSPDLTAQPPPSDAAKRAQEEPHSGGRFWSAFDTPASLEPQAAPPAFPEAQAGGSSWEAFEEGPTRVPRPADPYGPQLVQLSEMGFKDTRQCMAALQKAGGDISVAAELLIGKPPQQQPPAAAAGSLASAGPSPREEPVRAVFTASQPPPSRVLSPSVQAPPPFMTDLISLDDEPRPPPFCPQQSAAPVDVSAFASSFDLIGFGSDTQPSGSFQAPHPPPLSSSLLPPPTVPLYFESKPAP